MTRYQEQLYMLSERSKLSLLSFLLLLILGFLAFTSARTFQAVHNFQQQYSKVNAGDVSTMRPWMTVHTISHLYHIPENNLYRSLTMDSATLSRHATLYQIAAHKRQPVDQVIHAIQHTILVYRKYHSRSLTHSSDSKFLLPIRGRAIY